MPFVPFRTRFPDVAREETRSVLEFDEGVQKRGLLFDELYCDEAGCDCRRVIFHVLSDEPGREQPRATLSWGWEPDAFYRKWAGFPLEPDDLEELLGPALQRLAQQSEEAPDVLEKLRMLLESAPYRERIVRHYRMFRESVAREPREVSDPLEAPLNRAERRRRAKLSRRR